MCGRYTLSTPGERLRDVFGVEESLELEPRFNIAPTQSAPIVRPTRLGERLSLRLARWGLVPYWAEDPSIGNRMINARAETVDMKPAYRDSFASRRCLIPADGFYEWRRIGRHKQPYFFSRPDGEPFAFAGLWARWTGEQEPLDSFTLITTDASGSVAPVHDRMPVILAASQWHTWLRSSGGSASELKTLLRPAPDELLEAYPVSTFVNNPANDSSRCVEALDETLARDETQSEAQDRLF